MASEKSLHRKIQLVLEQAGSSGPSNLKDLIKTIEGKQLPSFNTLQYDNKTDEFHWRVSVKVIDRAVRLCAWLGLIGEDGHLTEDGRLALRKTQFNAVLAEKIRGALDHKGVPMAKLNDAIKQGFKSDPPVLPTAKALWAALSPEIRAADFSQFLTLLSYCGAAECSQAKVYLRIGNSTASGVGEV
jgi:hypothetical protein